jgi:hypothetical protein
MTISNPTAATMRSVLFDDCVEATKFLSRLGLDLPEGTEAARAHWRRLWLDNPAMQIDGPKPSYGWLLEDHGKMVGFFGNIPLLYYYGDQPVIVAEASQWGVDKDYRSETSRLAEAYFTQSNAGVLMVTTAIKPTGRIFIRHDAAPIPQADYDQVLYWIIDHRAFVAAAVRKKGLNKVAAKIVSIFGGLSLAALSAPKRSVPPRNLDMTVVIVIDDISVEFDDLWDYKWREKKRLLACRNADSLRWHFGSPSLKEKTKIIGYRSDKLEGYAVIMREDAPSIGLRRLKIVDLFVRDDNESVINTILARAFIEAKEQKCHVLELIGLPSPIRKKLAKHHPRVRPLPTWPLFYKLIDPSLGEALRDSDSWYITSFDGDTTLI